MKPLFDAREALGAGPALHAFIIGVSDYSNLSGEDDPPRENHWGMKKLASAALSAYGIHEWLLSRRDNLAVPLATIRVLLSPSPLELAKKPELALASQATRANFVTAVQEWREDAKKDRQTIAFFYFAGHGLQLRNRRQVLLMDGFGSDSGLKLADGIDSEELFRGMAPSDGQSAISDRQIYFFDACRDSPEAAHAEYDELRPPEFWDIKRSPVDPRNAPLFYTCVPGRKAFGVPGESTIFSKALLQCLEGAAAVSPDQINWQVTLPSLVAHLQTRIDALNSDQWVQINGGGRDMVLHRLEKAPDVDIEIFIDPLTAADCVAVRINDAEERVVRMHAKPIPDVIRERLPAGEYEVKALIEPPVAPYVPRRAFCPAQPPARTWRLKVSP